MNEKRLVAVVRELLHSTKRSGSPRWILLIVAALVAYVVLRPALEKQLGIPLPDISRPSGSTPSIATDGQQAILDAYETRRSNLMVSAAARVKRVLPDDKTGDRHQRMILEFDSGHTLFLAHNIDLAPRVPAREGDPIEFKGEYEYNEQGGVIHWTHHDPAGRHEDGWLRHRGKLYQ